MRNPALLVKMLRVFSNELRQIHRHVRSILKLDKEKNQAYELLCVAESFYKSHELDHAQYAFNRYLSEYPSGKNRKRVEEFLTMIKEDKVYPSGHPLPVPEDGMDASAFSKNMTAEQIGASLEEKSDLSQTKNILAQAEAALSAKQYGDAITKFKECLGGPAPSTEEEKKLHEGAQYKIGLALAQKGDNMQALTILSKYVRSHSNGEYVRHALYEIASIEEAKGNKERANSIYHKVATMLPHDEITANARKKLQR